MDRSSAAHSMYRGVVTPFDWEGWVFKYCSQKLLFYSVSSSKDRTNNKETVQFTPYT